MSAKQDFLTFLSIPSVSSDLEQVHKAVDFVAQQFEDIADIHYYVCKNKKSALIVPKGVRPDELDIILNGHVDVVPAEPEQFEPKVEGDKIYARGAYDMKGGLWAAVMALKNVFKEQNPPKVGLQVVPDEEVGGFDGTLCQLQKGVRAKFVLTMEPSNFNIALAAKGVLWIEVIAHGKSAHGAYPWDGVNAIGILNSFINNLAAEFPNPNEEAWRTTYNLSKITTDNDTMNKIPDRAVLKVDIRYIPEDKDRLISFMENQQKQLPVEIKQIMLEPAFDTSKDNAYVQKLAEILKAQKIDFVFEKRNGSSDVRHFARYDIDGIELGPIGAGHHGKNEWVSWSSIEKLAEILEEFVRKV